MKKEDIKNKYYDDFEISTKSREKITKGVLEDLKNVPATSIVDLDDWRIEKVKKEKTYLDVVKKIGIAAVSLCATGAIIFGVAKYNDNKKDVNVSKNTIATESSQYNNDKEKEDYVGDEYVKVFYHSGGPAEKQVGHSKLNTANLLAKYGDIFYESEAIVDNEDNAIKWLAIKGKNDKDFTEIKDLKFEYESNVYSNGKNIISVYKKNIYKYDIATKNMEVINFFKDKELKNNNYDDHSVIQEIINIRNNIAYLYMDNYNHEKYDIVSWNTDTNEMKTEKSNVSIAVDYNSNDANYDYMDYYNVDYTENETNYDYIVVLYKDSEECMTLSLLSYTSNGLEEKIIRKNASVELSNLSRVVGKFAYLGDIVGKKVKSKDGYEELKIEKATIYIYDVQSGEEKERAKIDVKDFGEGAQNMYIEEHELEDYCTVSVYFKDKSSKKYKYMFDTKEIKEIL